LGEDGDKDTGPNGYEAREEHPSPDRDLEVKETLHHVLSHMHTQAKRTSAEAHLPEQRMAEAEWVLSWHRPSLLDMRPSKPERTCPAYVPVIVLDCPAANSPMPHTYLATEPSASATVDHILVRRKVARIKHESRNYSQW
jgi:hypothetical protein